jgi:hypothetical protein
VAPDGYRKAHADGLKSGADADLIGALRVLFIWNRLVVHHVVSDPGGPGSSAGPPPGRP